VKYERYHGYDTKKQKGQVCKPVNLSQVKGLGAPGSHGSRGSPPRDPNISISTSFTWHTATIIWSLAINSFFTIFTFLFFLANHPSTLSERGTSLLIHLISIILTTHFTFSQIIIIITLILIFCWSHSMRNRCYLRMLHVHLFSLTNGHRLLYALSALLKCESLCCPDIFQYWFN